jgi:hypothetical protein
VDADVAALLERYRSSPDALDAALARIPPSRHTESWRGGWSVRQILGHLADDDLVVSQRIRVAIAEPGNPVLPYDNHAWETRLPYQDVPVEIAAAFFRALRAFNTAIFEAMPAAAWDQAITHPERGEVSVRSYVETYADHGWDHVADLNAIADAIDAGV